MVLAYVAVASSSSESFARASLRSLPEQHLLPYQERNRASFSTQTGEMSLGRSAVIVFVRFVVEGGL